MIEVYYTVKLLLKHKHLKNEIFLRKVSVGKEIGICVMFINNIPVQIILKSLKRISINGALTIKCNVNINSFKFTFESDSSI